MTIRTTGLGDLPRERIGQPDPVILPDPLILFVRRAERLRVLAVAHPMADWLRFLALIADAQHRASGELGPLFPPVRPALDAIGDTVTGETQALPLVSWTRMTRRTVPASPRPGHDTLWPSDPTSLDRILAHIIAVGDDPSLPGAAREVLFRLPAFDVHALAEAWLTGTMTAKQAGEAVPIAAALQVWFTRQAASLDVAGVHLLPRRGRCPVCASAPIAGVITAAGRAPGARYLHCGLCATAWNHVRALCIGCGESRGLALQEVEGGTGAIKAETCDVCHGYAKMFFQAKDMAIEPFADDLASLGLDLMVSDAGWSRLAPHPFRVFG